jgi:hypothetical protein
MLIGMHGTIKPQIMPHTCNVPTRLDFVPSIGSWKFAEGVKSAEKLLFLSFPDQMEILLATQRDKRYPHRAAMDPWKLRERFLNLKHSDDQLLRFLNDIGTWDNSLGPFRPENIWSWQNAIKHMLLQPNRKWQGIVAQYLNPYVGFQGVAAYLDCEFTLSDEAFWLQLIPLGCLGALIGTVLLDRSERARFRVCARDDCRQLYRLQSRHKRKYCSYDCAHIESVRSDRKRKKGQPHRKKRR